MLHQAKKLTPSLALLAVFMLPGAARAGTLSPDLEQLARTKPGQRVTVILQAKGRPGNELTRQVTRAGATLRRSFTSVPGFWLDLTAGAARSLAARADVFHVSLDQPVLGALDLSTAATGATAARQETGLDGSGVTVAVLDTGVGNHPDLVSPRSRIVGWVDWINRRGAPYDDSGHGTHVAGIIAGNGSAAASAGRDLRGVAPGARLYAVKVLDRDMRGSIGTVLLGLESVLANKDRLNIRVVNMSLGTAAQQSYTTDPLCRAVEAVWKAGIVVVTSAGNLGRIDPADPNGGIQYGYITSPGIDPAVITVGASKSKGTPDPSDDEVATYSSRGPTFGDHILKPDLIAPGNKVLAPISDGELAADDPSSVVTLGRGRYMTLSGTSMAAPVVAGTVALMLQRTPGLTPDTVKARLMYSALPSWNPQLTATPYDRGAGLLSVPAALASTRSSSGTAYSPTVVRLDDEGDFTWTVTVPPGDAGGDRMLWGDGMLWGDRMIWGDRMLWGDGMLWGDRMIWGDQAVWGDRMLWGDSTSGGNRYYVDAG